MQRGEAEAFVEKKKNISLVHWQNKTYVTVGTDKMNAVLALGNCNRWSAKYKKVPPIPQQKEIQLYNNGMGDVDQ